MAISISTSVIPKKIRLLLNLACELIAFFTETRPTCTSIHATIIKTSCSIVKKRRLASFIFSLRCFILSNHCPLKYKARPTSSCISMLSMKKKLLRLSFLVNSFLLASPLIAFSTVHSPKSKINQRNKLCITRSTCMIIFFCKSKGLIVRPPCPPPPKESCGQRSPFGQGRVQRQQLLQISFYISGGKCSGC